MGVWVSAFDFTIIYDYANEMAYFSVCRRRISRCGEDTKTYSSKLRIWGSEVRILPGAPVYETSRVNRTAFTRPPYPGNREHARSILNRSDYESGGRRFESFRARQFSYSFVL